MLWRTQFLRITFLVALVFYSTFANPAFHTTQTAVKTNIHICMNISKMHINKKIHILFIFVIMPRPKANWVITGQTVNYSVEPVVSVWQSFIPSWEDLPSYGGVWKTQMSQDTLLAHFCWPAWKTYWCESLILLPQAIFPSSQMFFFFCDRQKLFIPER